MAIGPDQDMQFYSYWSGTFPVSIAYINYNASVAIKYHNIQLQFIKILRPHFLINSLEMAAPFNMASFPQINPWKSIDLLTGSNL